MAEFKFFCPGCGQQIQCDTAYAGSPINCPACNQTIDVPRQGEIPAGKPPAPVKSKTPIILGVVILFLVLAGAGLFLFFFLKPSNKPAGLVDWWQAEGNARDKAGHNHGVLRGDADFAGGEFGRAFNFNGNGQYVEIPRSASLNPDSQLTIEFWMKADPNNPMNSYEGLVTSDFYGIEIANGVSFYLSSNHGASWAITSHASLTPGVWHHIAGTFDGAKLRLYVDGQLWGSPLPHTGKKISPMLANSFVAIGSEDGRTGFPDCIGSRYFNGLIDEVCIYNRALSEDEIATIYNSGPKNAN
jgi:hypothetical protein